MDHVPTAKPELNSSVAAVVGCPPKANADVLVAPAPANRCLPVFKLLATVQLVPFQDSVCAFGDLLNFRHHRHHQ